MGFAIPLFILGVLGASNLIIARKPDAKELIAKISPYQGWIGAICALYGVWGIISSVLSLSLLGSLPIYWALGLATSVVMVALGVLLGIGTLKTFIKQPQAVAKMDQLVTKLAPKQGVLGLIAIGLSVACIVVSFLHI
jgi:hypothetical protein